MIYEFIRPLTCPFEKIEKYVPKKGKILDVGCGHGLFAKLIANKSSQREVLGIDLSKEKIRLARYGSLAKNLKFKVKKLESLKEKFDAITIIDVLYLFPLQEKIKFFQKCKKILIKNGLIILVENGDGGDLIYRILKIQETVMTNYLKFTYTRFKGLHFLSGQGYKDILASLGFKIKRQENLKSIFPYPHFLIVAKVT